MPATTDTEDTKVLSFRPPKHQHQEIEERANREGNSVSAVIRALVARGLDAERGLRRRG